MKIVALKPKWGRGRKAIPLPDGFDAQVAECVAKIKADRHRGKKTWAYIHNMQDWDGEIVETVHAVKWFKATKSKPEHAVWQLAFAGTPTRRWSSGNLFFGKLCGYFLNWEPGNSVNCGVWAYPFSTKMGRCDDDRWYPHFEGIISFANPRALKNYPKYLDTENMLQEIGRLEVIEFVRNFIDFPDVEMLQKANLTYLWSEKRLLKAKPKFRKKLLSYLRQNLKEIQTIHPSMSSILAAMRRGLSIMDNEWAETVIAVDAAVCGFNGFFMHDQAEEVAKYLQRQNGGPIHYRDYLELSQRMGRDMDARGVLFPKDFCRQFDELIALSQAEKAKEMEEGIRKQIEKLGLPERYDHKGFSVRVLDTQDSMTEIGNTLHNCVGTGGYGLRMANGDIVVLAVYWNGNPINCVELSTPKDGAMYRVKQNRGDHNRDSDKQQEVSRFLEGYIRKANKAWRGCHASA